MTGNGAAGFLILRHLIIQLSDYGRLFFCAASGIRRRRGVLHERPTEATYLVQDNYTVDTRDYEDHTFNGVMFDMIINPEPPVKEIIVNSLWVRGRLGPMQVNFFSVLHLKSLSPQPC
jgi:hypothetical protein